MKFKARLDVRIVEMTDAVQASLYWSLMRAWALDYKAERSDQDPAPLPGTGPERCGAGALVTALEDGIPVGIGTSQYQISTTI